LPSLPESNIMRPSSASPSMSPRGVMRVGERSDHQHDEDKRAESGDRGEDAGHGRTILRAATRPALPGSSTPPSTSAPAMSSSAAQMTRAAQSLDAACSLRSRATMVVRSWSSTSPTFPSSTPQRSSRANDWNRSVSRSSSRQWIFRRTWLCGRARSRPTGAGGTCSTPGGRRRTFPIPPFTSAYRARAHAPGSAGLTSRRSRSSSPTGYARPIKRNASSSPTRSRRSLSTKWRTCRGCQMQELSSVGKFHSRQSFLGLLTRSPRRRGRAG
jgi:hypothetical protein